MYTGTWLLIGDSQDPVWRWSSFNVLSTSGNRAPRGPLSSLQEGLLRTAGNTLPNPRLPHSAPSVVSYLEQQLLASKALGSAQEYVHWLMALVSFLLTQGTLYSLYFIFVYLKKIGFLNGLLFTSYSFTHNFEFSDQFCIKSRHA